MGCGASMSEDYEANKAKEHVLVIGGGFGGASCCQRLHKHGIDFTLVDPKAFFFHKLASIRAVVQPELTEKLALDYKAAFGDKFTQDQTSSFKFGFPGRIFSGPSVCASIWLKLGEH